MAMEPRTPEEEHQLARYQHDALETLHHIDSRLSHPKLARSPRLRAAFMVARAKLLADLVDTGIPPSVLNVGGRSC